MTTRHGIMSILVCYEEILKEERSFSPQSSVFNFFKLSSETCASSPAILDTGDDPDDRLAVQEGMSPLQTVTCSSDYTFFVKFS
jgi:hypothetical protein